MNLHSFDGGRIAVWGYGIEGRAAEAWFSTRADTRIVTDDRADLADTLAWADVIIRSPGVNPRRPELRQRRVTTLTDLWLHEPRTAPVIGVTGTKGKSTTTMITTQLLEAAGLRVGMGGNIEVPVTLLPLDSDVFVIEASSYMASDLTTSPDFGILTNLGDDHLTWHGSVERYRADKLNLFAGPELQRLAVNGLDPIALAATATLPVTTFGSSGYTRRGTTLFRDDAEIADLAGTNLGNAHFALNACAALTAAQWVLDGPIDDQMAAVAHGYTSLPSRLHRVGEVDGIEFVDDALASNPTGARASIEAFAGRPLAVILGGADRDVEFDGFFAWLAERGTPTCAVLISDIAAELANLAQRHGVSCSIIEGDDFDAAVAACVAALPGGGVALFSPAAATPPAIGNYKERSARFIAAVGRL